MGCPACVGRRSVRIVPGKGGSGSSRAAGGSAAKRPALNPNSARAQGSRMNDRLRFTGRKKDGK